MDARRMRGRIVVNYASADLLAENLTATAAAVPDARIVVVDNRPTAEERARVEALSIPHGWRLVPMDDHAGIRGGAHAAPAVAFDEPGVTDILLLNPDARIDGASVDAVAAATADGPSVASPRVEDAAGRVWFAGMDVYLDDGSMGGPRRRREQAGARRLPWLSGACLWFTRDAWRLTGGPDDAHFPYREDDDTSVRAARA